MSNRGAPRDHSRRVVFGHADEHPYRRLTGDWVRVVLAIVAVWVTAANPQFLHAAERTLDAFFATLPGSFDGVFEVALAVGYLWGLALVVAAALVARRFRLASVIAASGIIAWAVARFLGFAIVGNSLWSALGKVFSADEAAAYPTVRLAVLAAVVLVASPFLTRPVRRLGQLVLLVVAPGTLVLGLGGVDAVVGAVALGWGVAAAVHLVLGSPAGRPTMAQVGAALAELGVVTTSVELAADQPAGSTIVDATRPVGPPLRVRVYGRDAADTRLAAKAWRFLAYKDSGPTLTLTRLQQVEHEAVCLFAARDAGAHVPVIVAAGVAGPSAALLALDQPDLPSLTQLPEDHDADAAVAALWSNVRRLRDARVATARSMASTCWWGTRPRRSSTSTAARSPRPTLASTSTSRRRSSRPRCGSVRRPQSTRPRASSPSTSCVARSATSPSLRSRRRPVASCDRRRACSTS